jgi:hypothetical protein
MSHKIFRVVVDYDRSIEDGVKAGDYDWSNSDITSSRFPSTRKGTLEIDIHLIHFNKDMSNDQVLFDLDELNFRPAEPQELLSLGAAYPDLQREFPIPALGSVWRYRLGDCVVPCLVGSDSDRGLDLVFIDDDWSELCHFAAVRK